ncbi:zinc finger protein 836-like [Mercenaria mercenaria]|uniref:zinc finger protein 836-like n=1 Tax=Mercenaria mercenaria TaxID=6596 RepID=UPI00234F3FB0|nr:zinc finger protein 836-like [Mercenaria mercenaria]
MAHICKQRDGSENLLNCISGIRDTHLNVYRCGGCNTIFETICVLHTHMQSHTSGGSYHYNHFFSTAFPKYGCSCIGSQTDFDSGIVQRTSTGSQTDLNGNDINDILLPQSNTDSNKYYVSGGFNSLEKSENNELKNKANHVKLEIGLGCLQDDTSAYTEDISVSSVSCEEIGIENENTESREEQRIKIERNNANKIESIDEVVEDQRAHLGDGANDGCYKSSTDGKRYVSGYNSLLRRQTGQNRARLIEVAAEESKEMEERVRDNVDSVMDENFYIKCQICEKQVSSSGDLKRHIESVHSKESGKGICDYPCKYCSFNFRSKKELLKHIKNDHSETDKKFSCPYCEEEFLTSTTKTTHMESEHPEIVQVLKKFHQSKNTDSHTACDLCGKIFSTAAGLALHMSSIHLKKKFKCDICNVELSQKFTLKAHKIEKHHEDMRGFDCNICKKTFAYRFRLKAHIEQMHTPHDETGNKYICETCGYFSKTKAGLRYHLTKHDDQRKQYQCSVCPYKTYYKCSMTEHIISHQGNRRFICDVCGDKFFTGKQLKVHMRRHTGELPYQCEICNKRFRTDIAYARHRDIHLNKMRFKCDYCDKEFVQKTNCLAHMRQHTGEKPFKCDWCGQCFTHNVSRKNHMNKCVYKPPVLNLTEAS